MKNYESGSIVKSISNPFGVSGDEALDSALTVTLGVYRELKEIHKYCSEFSIWVFYCDGELEPDNKVLRVSPRNDKPLSLAQMVNLVQEFFLLVVNSHFDIEFIEVSAGGLYDDQA